VVVGWVFGLLCVFLLRYVVVGLTQQPTKLGTMYEKHRKEHRIAYSTPKKKPVCWPKGQAL